LIHAVLIDILDAHVGDQLPIRKLRGGFLQHQLFRTRRVLVIGLLQLLTHIVAKTIIETFRMLGKLLHQELFLLVVSNTRSEVVKLFYNWDQHASVLLFAILHPLLTIVQVIVSRH